MNSELLITVTVLVVAILSITVVGRVLTAYASNFLRLSLANELIWAASPLVGAGAIILFCQNLLYLDISIIKSTLIIWITIGAFGVYYFYKSDFSFRNIPWRLILTCLIIYALHGITLILSGASNYYGYGWGDMYNYVSQAQFFVDYPFSSAIDSQEYLRTAQVYKADRIGQSVLHAFITASSGADAQQTFGATILLAPLLVFCAFTLLSSALGIKQKISYPASIIASILPALATIHLECFFSQVMAIPYLILSPLVFSRLYRSTFSSILLAGLLLSVIASIYTELVPAIIIVNISILLISFLCIKHNSSSRRFLFCTSVLKSILITVLVITVALLSNIGFIKSILIIFSRTLNGGELNFIYPWAFQPEGLARLWLGNQLPTASLTFISYALAIFSLATFLGAFLYALFLIKRRWDRLEAEGGYTALYCALVIFFPFAPIFATLVTSNNYSYQFYKLLLCIWPLTVYLFICGISSWLLIKYKSFRLMQVAQAIFIIACGSSTLWLVLKAGNPDTVARSQRGAAHLLIDDNFKIIRSKLSALHGKQIYIWLVDKSRDQGNWSGRWLAYFARHNKVWSLNLPPASIGGASEWSALPKANQQELIIGISWRDVAVKNKEKIGSIITSADPFWIYSTNDLKEIEKIDNVSRGYISRSMLLHLNQRVDENKWYPIWVAGRAGFATIISVNFSKVSTRFRYDQWGYPAQILDFKGDCIGNDLSLKVNIDVSNGVINIECNRMKEAGKIVVSPIFLNANDPLGINKVVDLLEGKYPLDKSFPGNIIEN